MPVPKPRETTQETIRETTREATPAITQAALPVVPQPVFPQPVFLQPAATTDVQGWIAIGAAAIYPDKSAAGQRRSWDPESWPGRGLQSRSAWSRPATGAGYAWPSRYTRTRRATARAWATTRTSSSRWMSRSKTLAKAVVALRLYKENTTLVTFQPGASPSSPTSIHMKMSSRGSGIGYGASWEPRMTTPGRSRRR